MWSPAVVHLMQGARGVVPAFLRSLVSRTVPIVLSLVAALTFGVWLLGSHNPYTPAGYVGYLTKGAVFGQSRFYAVQRGPTSPGRRWLLDVTNVSVTPYTYTAAPPQASARGGSLPR